MGYGSASRCEAEEEQLLRAVKQGVVPVAAAAVNGPAELYPAALPHVLAVGAVGPDSAPAEFSTESPALDVSAPGVSILTAVPVSADGDGFSRVGGTGVSAAMVAATVAWVRAARPELTAGQAAQVVRLGARDVGAAGRDSSTGFGVLSVAGALREPAPEIDPGEPDDDIRLVDGRFFRSASAPFSRGRPASVTATLDRSDDPVDVHRFEVPAGRRVRVSVTPSVGDPDLYVMSRRARSVRDDRRVLGRSRKGSTRTDAVMVRNRNAKRTAMYAVVAFSTAKPPRGAEAAYTLALERR